MPLYEYQCDACSHRFERIRKFSDPPLTECPSCGGSVRKLLSSPAIQFKGTGWYITDYAKKSSSEGGKSSDSGRNADGGKASDSNGSSSAASSSGDSSASSTSSSSSGSSSGSSAGSSSSGSSGGGSSASGGSSDKK